MSEIEKMKRYIERTKMSTIYQINIQEAFALAHQAYAANDLPIEMVSLAFKYGQAKGYRAAKAERRAQA